MSKRKYSDDPQHDMLYDEGHPFPADIEIMFRTILDVDPGLVNDPGVHLSKLASNEDLDELRKKLRIILRRNNLEIDIVNKLQKDVDEYLETKELSGSNPVYETIFYNADYYPLSIIKMLYRLYFLDSEKIKEFASKSYASGSSSSIRQMKKDLCDLIEMCDPKFDPEYWKNIYYMKFSNCSKPYGFAFAGHALLLIWSGIVIFIITVNLLYDGLSTFITLTRIYQMLFILIVPSIIALFRPMTGGIFLISVGILLPPAVIYSVSDKIGFIPLCFVSLFPFLAGINFVLEANYLKLEKIYFRSSKYFPHKYEKLYWR